MEAELILPSMATRKRILPVLYKALLFLPVKMRMFLYWKFRAREFGRRSVLNLSHASEEYDAVTTAQRNEIFPILSKHLRGDEKICLDFGCGSGRFTGALAKLIEGKCIGVDPIRELLQMAPKSADVEYRLMRHGKIPVSDESVDMTWCCLVLGGIHNSLLQNTVKEMERVLKMDGLLILVENTSKKMSGEYWMFRSEEYYGSLIPSVRLRSVHQYEDCSETISIMIGRKENPARQ